MCIDDKDGKCVPKYQLGDYVSFIHSPDNKKGKISKIITILGGKKVEFLYSVYFPNYANFNLWYKEGELCQ